MMSSFPLNRFAWAACLRRAPRQILPLLFLRLFRFFRLAAVVLRHRRVNALRQNHLHGVAGLADHLRRNFQLRLFHRPEHVLFAAAQRMLGSATQPEPRKFLCADGADHGLGAVVAPRTAVRMNPDRPPRQLHFIPEHQQVVHIQIVLLQQLSHRDAAEIHVRLRLRQDHIFPGNLSSPRERFALGPFHANPAAIRQFIYGHESQVMRRPLILRIGIPKSDNKPHSLLSKGPASAGLLLQNRCLLFLLRFLFLGLGLCFLCLSAFFAFHFLLALLDDFGLSRRCYFRCHGLGGLLFLYLERNHVRDHALRLGEHFDFSRIDRQVAHAQLFAEHQLGDVQLELRRNVGRQAFDFHFTRHDFEHTALHFHARRLTERVHRHLHLHAHIHRHPHQVHVQELSRYRIDQPIFQDGRLRFAAQIHLKQRVVSAFRAQYRAYLLGVHRQCNWTALPTVQNGRNLAGLTKPPRFVLAPFRARRACHHNLLCHDFLPFLLNSLTLQLASNKQFTDRSLFVNRANPSRQQVRHTQHANLSHLLRCLTEGHGIRGYYLTDLGLREPFYCRTGKHRVCASREHLRGSFPQKRLGGLHQRSRRVDNVIHHQRAASTHVANQVHHFA